PHTPVGTSGQADDASVGGGSDAERQSAVGTHRQIGQPVIALGGHPRDDRSAAAVAEADGGNHAHLVTVAVGDVEPAVMVEDSPDRAVDSVSRLGGADAEGEVSVGIDIEPAAVGAEAVDGGGAIAEAAFGDQDRPLVVKGDGGGAGEVVDVAVEGKSGGVFD